MKSTPLLLSPLPPSRVHWGCRWGSPSEFGVQSSGGIRLGLCGDTGVPEVLGVEQGLGGLSCEGSFAGPSRAGASLNPASWEGIGQVNPSGAGVGKMGLLPVFASLQSGDGLSCFLRGACPLAACSYHREVDGARGPPGLWSEPRHRQRGAGRQSHRLG